jgi:hypothetical protein
MNERSRRIVFAIFRMVLVGVIVVESLITLVHSLHSTTESRLGSILPYFAGLEGLAALMLLIPKTVKFGGVILFGIFAAALVVHGPAQQMPLIVYAAGVLLLMSNAPAGLPGNPRSKSGDEPNKEEL